MSVKETVQALRRQFDHTFYLFDETISHIASIRDTLRWNGIEPKDNCW